MKPIKSLLDQAKEKFANFRESVIDAAKVLYEISSTKAWESVADSFGEYVESELQISQGFASKLVSVWRHYCIENDVSPVNLAGTDYELLYLAAKTKGSVDEQLSRAKTLSRAELKKERQETDEHEFEPLVICKICHGSKENHN